MSKFVLKAAVFLLVALSPSFSFCQNTLLPCFPEIENPNEGSSEGTLCAQFPNFVPDITIGNATQGINSLTLASSLSSLLPFDGKKILIYGTIIADVPLVFNNCTVKMTDKATITTSNNSFFYSYNSKFFSCTKMWNGIDITSGCAAYVYYSQFEDALNTFFLGDKVICNFYGNLFNRNRVVLSQIGRTGFWKNSGFSFVLDYFGDNVFDCTSNLLPPPTGLEQYNEKKSVAGFYLYKSSCAIGKFNTGANTFRNLTSGVVAGRSGVVFQNCNFVNNTYGIDANLSTISVETVQSPWLPNSLGKCNFNNNYIGIKLSGCYNTKVKEAFFESNVVNSYGIYSAENAGSEVQQFLNNTINLFQKSLAGIYIQRSPAPLNGTSASNTISKNRITLQNNSLDNGHGILVESSASKSLDFMVIDDNTVDMNCSSSLRQVGIFVRNSSNNNCQITKNKINATSLPGGFWGIAMVGETGAGNVIKNNTVSGVRNAISSSLNCSIHIEDAPSVLVCDNYVDGSNNGFHLVAGNDGMDFSLNHFDHHKYCILVAGTLGGKAGIIGKQVRTNNYWPSDPSHYTEGARNTNPSVYVSASEFLIQNSNLVLYPNPVLPLAFFREESGSLNLCKKIEGGPNQLSEYRVALIDDNFSDTSTSAIIKQDLKRNILYTLLTNPSWINTATISSFYNANITTNIGKFAMIQAEFDNMTQSTLTISQDIKNYQAIYDSFNARLISANSNATAASTVASVQAVLQLTLLDTMARLSELIHSSKEQMAQNLSSAANVTKSHLNNISTISSSEAYLKIIYLGLLEEIIDGQTSASTLSLLSNIAAQDVVLFGEVVSMAYRWLPLCHRPLLSDNTLVEYRDNRVPIDGSNEFVKLLPNPASSVIAIELPNNFAATKCIVSSLEGRNVLTQQFELDGMQTFNVNIENLPTGMYIVEIFNNEQRKLATKFYKIK